jgi:Flp pilus assembly pilin Flp
MKYQFEHATHQFKRFLRDESGSAMEEYLIIGALLVVVAITVVAGIGASENNMAYEKVQHGLKVR